MKYLFKKHLIVILFLMITLCMLWTNVFVTYNSPDEFAEKSSDAVYTYDIIAQDENYAVGLARSKQNKEDIFYILQKIKDGKWKQLSKNFDYKEKSYFNMTSNPDFIYIYTFELMKNNTNIIIILDYFYSESNIKLHNVCDSKNTVFYYSSANKIKKMPYYAAYIGFVENFDKNNYTLNINNNIYPYKDWEKLIK